MRAIGFRVTPSEVYFVVVDGSKQKPVLISTKKLSPSKIYSEAARLMWYRQRVQAAVTDHNASAVGIRYPEPGSPSLVRTRSMERLRIEGVVLECVESLGIPINASGPERHIKKKLNAEQSLKNYSKAGTSFRGITMSDVPKVYHDCLFAAVACLEDA